MYTLLTPRTARPLLPATVPAPARYSVRRAVVAGDWPSRPRRSEPLIARPRALRARAVQAGRDGDGREVPLQGASSYTRNHTRTSVERAGRRPPDPREAASSWNSIMSCGDHPRGPPPAAPDATATRRARPRARRRHRRSAPSARIPSSARSDRYPPERERERAMRRTKGQGNKRRRVDGDGSRPADRGRLAGGPRYRSAA